MKRQQGQGRLGDQQGATGEPHPGRTLVEEKIAEEAYDEQQASSLRDMFASHQSVEEGDSAAAILEPRPIADPFVNATASTTEHSAPAGTLLNPFFAAQEQHTLPQNYQQDVTGTQLAVQSKEGSDKPSATATEGHQDLLQEANTNKAVPDESRFGDPPPSAASQGQPVLPLLYNPSFTPYLYNFYQPQMGAFEPNHFTARVPFTVGAQQMPHHHFPNPQGYQQYHPSQMPQQQQQATNAAMSSLQPTSMLAMSPQMAAMMPPNFAAAPTNNPSMLMPQQQALGSAPSDPGLTGRRPVSLALDCDRDSLSAYQCLVREQIDVFEAGFEDIESNAQGRNRRIVLGQVGIQCRHCIFIAPKHRSRGAIYYPTKLQGLYQAAQNMASTHLCEHCQHISAETRAKLLKVRERKSSAGGGKKYWAEAVRVLGVIESEDGLRFSPVAPAAAVAAPPPPPVASLPTQGGGGPGAGGTAAAPY